MTASGHLAAFRHLSQGTSSSVKSLGLTPSIYAPHFQRTLLTQERWSYGKGFV